MSKKNSIDEDEDEIFFGKKNKNEIKNEGILLDEEKEKEKNLNEDNSEKKEYLGKKH